MRRVWKRVVLSLLAPMVTYLGIATGLIVFGTAAPDPSSRRQLSFDELLRIDYSILPPLRQYKARDGSRLDYRYYPSTSDRTLVLLHGSGWHSRYFLPLAAYLASSGLADVYTPDLRGHGHRPARRGDVDYIGQYEDDLADLIEEIKRRPTGSTPPSPPPTIRRISPPSRSPSRSSSARRMMSSRRTSSPGRSLPMSQRKSPSSPAPPTSG